MKALVYIDNDQIGKADLKIIDESMGVVGGDLIVTDAYDKFRHQIQYLFEKQGIAGMMNFNFRMISELGDIINAEGGIGIIDSSEFNELLVEAAGVDLRKFNND